MINQRDELIGELSATQELSGEINVGEIEIQPNLQEKNVTPTTSMQTITPDSGYDGLSSVEVNAVDNSIDNNIQAQNIKKDITILGITGSYDPDVGVQTLNDGAYLFQSKSRINQKEELMAILNQPISMKYFATGCVGETFDFRNLDTSLCTDFTGIFENNTTSILEDYAGVLDLDYSNCTACGGMFSRVGSSISDEKFNQLPIVDDKLTIKFTGENNFKKVTNCSSMFNNFYLGLTSRPNVDLIIDLSECNFSNAYNCSSMFYSVGATKVILPQFSASVSFQNFFINSPKLIEVDMSRQNVFGSSGRLSSMFQGCTSLMKIDMRKFPIEYTRENSSYYSNMFGSTASNSVPSDCLIIVKDDTSKQWLASHFPQMTNVQTVAEYEAN